MFCQCNATLQQNDQKDTSTDQSCPQLDSTESHKLTSVSRPQSVPDVVAVNDNEGTVGLHYNQTQVRDINQRTLHRHPREPDCSGILSNTESSHDNSTYFKIQGRGGSLSEEARDCKLDLFFEQNRSERECANYSDDSGLIPGSWFTLTQDHENSFFEQNGKDKNPRKCNTGIQSDIKPFHVRSKNLEDNERQRFLLAGTQVCEQKNLDRNFQEHLADDSCLGLCRAVEHSPERFRYSASKQSDKPLFNFSQEDWSARSVLERLQPDDAPPAPKRLRTSLSGVAHPSAKKSSASRQYDKPVSSKGVQYDKPVSSKGVQTSLLAETQPAAKASSLLGGRGIPVEKSVHTEEVVLPRSRVYNARSVLLMQSQEGMHVITEDTVAHTVFGSLSPESGPSQHLAVGYYNTEDQRNRNRATFSSDCSTKLVPEGSDDIRANSRVREIILSPCENSTAVVTRAPSKKSTSYLPGRTDRADIAGGWRPISGQTVARKPARPSQDPILSTSSGIRKPSQPFQDSLWTTFDAAAKKSTTHTQLSGQDRFTTAKNDQEPVLVSSALRSGVCGKSGKPTKDPLALSSVTTAIPSNRHDPIHIQGRPPDIAVTSCIVEKRDLARVQSMTWKNNVDQQPGTFRKPAVSVRNSVEVSSRNTYESATVMGDQHQQASSFGHWIETAAVENVQKKKTSGCGAGVNYGAVELPSRTIHGFYDVGFPACKPGSAMETSLGGRSDPVRVHSVERRSSSNGGGREKEDAMSKWNRFQEIADVSHHLQPPVRSSSLVRTTNRSPFQHSQEPAAQTTSSNLVSMSSVHSSLSSVSVLYRCIVIYLV